MLSLVNVVKIQSYPVGQNSFTEKIPYIWNKKIILEINGWTFDFIVNSPFL